MYDGFNQSSNFLKTTGDYKLSHAEDSEILKSDLKGLNKKKTGYLVAEKVDKMRQKFMADGSQMSVLESSAGMNGSANVVDINSKTRIPTTQKKKNKNDFYRFLLSQNYGLQSNYDVLIPRSILKKNLADHEKSIMSKGPQTELTDLDHEVITGQHLNRVNPLLSPKFNQVLSDLQKQEQELQDFTQEQQYVQRDLEPSQNQSQPNVQASMNSTQLEPQTSMNSNNQPQKLTHQESPQIKSTTDQNQSSIQSNQQLSNDLVIEKLDQNASQNTIVQNKNQSQADNQSIVSQKVPSEKIKVRHLQQDGFFETGVDVIEHEYDVDGEELAKHEQINQLYRDGKITEAQLKELLIKKLKDERIFGYQGYDDFNQNYFTKELLAIENLNRLKWIKDSRKNYENRWQNNKQFAQMPQNQQQYQQHVYTFQNQSPSHQIQTKEQVLMD